MYFSYQAFHYLLFCLVPEHWEGVAMVHRPRLPPQPASGSEEDAVPPVPSTPDDVVYAAAANSPCAGCTSVSIYMYLYLSVTLSVCLHVFTSGVCLLSFVTPTSAASDDFIYAAAANPLCVRCTNVSIYPSICPFVCLSLPLVFVFLFHSNHQLYSR